MVLIRIYYAPGTVSGDRLDLTDAVGWRAAPDGGVQVVVRMEPYPDGRRPWAGVEHRQIWTGQDTYDPFGWGSKTGTLIDDAAYHALWNRAIRED